MRIGLDFGTTNSSAAIYKNNTLRFIQTPFTDGSGILQSLLYVTRSHDHFLGREAALRYLHDDSGRPAKWQTKYAGIIEYWIANHREPTLVRQPVYVQEDIGAKGRLLQSIKMGLQAANYIGTSIFDEFYTIEDLIRIILSELKTGAERELGRDVSGVLLGRPVKFSEKEEVDERSQIILCSAAQAAGFGQVDFMFEPVAAAYSYHVKLEDRHTALIFDFGGGTLDLTVVQIGGSQNPDILSTQGILVGGDDIDRQIMQSFLLKHFGHGKFYKEGVTLPREVYEQLLSWPRHPELTRGETYTKIKGAVFTCPGGAEFKALLELIDSKYGYQLFKAIEETKIKLSTEAQAIFSFHAGNIHIDEQISREAFARSIQDHLTQIDTGVQEVLAKAGLKQSQIDLVLCTGGSSAIPAVIDLLANRFGSDRIRQHDRFLGVSSGLAIAAASNYL